MRNFDAWRAILVRLRCSRPAMASVLEHAVPLQVGPERVLLGFEAKSFLGAQASEGDAVAWLTQEVRTHYNAATQVGLDVSLRVVPPLCTVAALDAESRKAATAEAKSAVQKHPLVQKAISLFGAELREVRLAGSDD